MNLCYLYYKSKTYPHAQTLLDAFSEGVSRDIENIEHLDEADIYLIELSDTQKDLSQKLIQIFKSRTEALVFCIFGKNYSLALFQLALLLESKEIITHSQAPQKVISKIKSQISTFKEMRLEQHLGRVQKETKLFFVLEKKSLFFVSKALLATFKCDSLETFSEEILLMLNTQKLINSETKLSIKLINAKHEKLEYTFQSQALWQDKTVVYVDVEQNPAPVELELKNEVVTTSKEPACLSSRISFIELLKEELIQRDISHKNLSLMAINITNIKKLVYEYSVVGFEELLYEVLLYADSILEKNLLFSQFRNNFYVVLYENCDFEKINRFALEFYAKLLQFIEKQKSAFTIDLYTYALQSHDLGSILTSLQSILENEFKNNISNASYIKHFTQQDEQLNVKKHLDEAYNNAYSLKLLNIYKGLVINTKAKIVKITPHTIYIAFESLQGVVLNVERETVLQSKHFAQDIYAEVKQINLNKKLAILENFKFLSSNANSRKHARVTTAIKIPASIITDEIVATGTIHDLSIKSLALRIKNIKHHPVLQKGKAKLTFNIPSKKAENGFVQLRLPVEVIIVTPLDKQNYYKVICDLDQDSYDLGAISEYVYERQKELIVELKKISKLN